MAALPDRIQVTTNVPQVGAAADASVEVTAVFLRDLGEVTEGLAAIFSATDATGAAIGLFRNVTVVTDESNQRQASADFLPLDTAYRGLVTLTVGIEGSPVTGSVVVEVIDP